MKVNIPKGKVMAKVQGAFDKGLFALSTQILNDMNEYVKWDKGTLGMSALVHSRLYDGQIIWQTPYARRQYYKIETAHTDVNPKATFRWCEKAKEEYGEQWEKQAQIIFKENL